MKTVATSFDYSATGDVRKMMLGNGLWETAQFNERLQLTQIGLGTTPTNNNQFKIDYEYGELNTDGTTVDQAKNIGNIAKQTTTIPTTSFVQTFKYDALNRLTEAKEKTGTTQNWRQTFGYDKFGNRTSFTQEGNLPANPQPTIDPTNNRFTTGQGYVYDYQGNLIQDAQGRSFKFNGDDKQTEVRNTSNNQIIGEYFYDGDGARIKKVVGGVTTVFVYDAAGDLAAEYSSQAPPQQTSTTSYLTYDHLGSPRVITNQQGQVTSRRDFMPFGEELGVGVGGRSESLKYSVTNADNIRQRFTGYEKDTETDLDFAQARMYQNKHGRFTAVDPLMASASATNPQTFNRYTYTGNNPVNYTDPLGLIWCQQDGTNNVTTAKKCASGWSPVKEGKVVQVSGGDWSDVGAKIGDIVRLNSNDTVTVLDPSNPANFVAVSEATGTTVSAGTEAINLEGLPGISNISADSILESAATHGKSAFMTWAENNGGSLVYNLGVEPFDEHTHFGQYVGNVASLVQGAAEIVIGGTTAAGGGAATILTSPLCVTGIGCAVPATTGTVTVGGVLVATHGAGVIVNTTINIMYNQGANSRSGGSGNSKSPAEMADDLQKEVGKNRVSAETATHQVNIDLKGKAHFDKATKKLIPTPHVQTYKKNVGPNGKINFSNGTTRPATKKDIRTARKIFNKK
jgi:RHS repeat-associated protein